MELPVEPGDFCMVFPAKTNMTGWKIHDLNEDVFPIIHGDFPACHASFRGVIHGNLIQPLPFTCGRNNMSPVRCESDF